MRGSGRRAWGVGWLDTAREKERKRKRERKREIEREKARERDRYLTCHINWKPETLIPNRTGK